MQSLNSISVLLVVLRPTIHIGWNTHHDKPERDGITGLKHPWAQPRGLAAEAVKSNWWSREASSLFKENVSSWEIPYL